VGCVVRCSGGCCGWGDGGGGGGGGERCDGRGHREGRGRRKQRLKGASPGA